MQHSYNPFLFLKNGHINTVFPTLFRIQAELPYERVELDTPDGDFLHVDCLFGGHKRLVILCHGLEGSSRSKYIVGSAKILKNNGWDVVSVNYRSCSGVMNRNLQMYHSGATHDLEVVVNHFIDRYEELIFVGFSLGGNLSLKYAGERGNALDERIKAIIGVSVPTDLGAGSLNIGQPSNFIYNKKFMVTLKEKMRQKAVDFPEDIDLELLEKIGKLYEFDDHFTGPINGFRDAEDYYTQCSSKKFIPHIERHAYIVNALDDPFLPEACYPYAEVASNRYAELWTPKHGGHVGFVQLFRKHYWIEELILAIAKKHSKFNEPSFI